MASKGRGRVGRPGDGAEARLSAIRSSFFSPEYELQMGQGEQCVRLSRDVHRVNATSHWRHWHVSVCACVRALALWERLAECRHLGNACRVSLSPRPHLQIRLLPPRLFPYQLDSSQVRQLLRDKSPLTSVALSLSLSLSLYQNSPPGLSLEDCPTFSLPTRSSVEQYYMKSLLGKSLGTSWCYHWGCTFFTFYSVNLFAN